jgi:uncharacterized protein YceK
MKAILVLLAVLALVSGCASQTTSYTPSAEANCARANGIWHAYLGLCEAQGK